MIFVFASFELDSEKRELWRERKRVKIDALIVRLLITLVENAGRLVTKEELIAKVWEGRPVADNVITVSMARLRRTLQDPPGDGDFVAAAYGRGYRFVCPVVSRDVPSPRTPSATQSQLATPPFLGRERLLRQLRYAWSGALAGHGQICVLIGEAGIGKTRLIEQLRRELSESAVRIVSASCRETADTPPLGPFRQIVQELARASDGEAPARGSELSIEADPTRARSLEQILRFLTESARRAPLMIVLEDLHRADAASIELLSILVGPIARAPLLVVATLRPASAGKPTRPETQLPALLGHRNCQRMPLERLSAQEVHAYVAAVRDDRDGRFGAAVFDKSEGNPFFMVELCRTLRHAETPDPSARTVEGAALDVVRRQVAKLDAEARGLLSVAAVIGGSFEISLLSTLTGRSPALLVGSLDDAIAADVIMPAPHSRTAFTFAHELLATALYEALPASERRNLHLRVGRALETQAASGERVPASELAYHFHAALPRSDLRKTVQYCSAAAVDAAAARAPVDVVRYAQQALAALESIEQPSARLRLRLWYFMTVYVRCHDGVLYARSVNELLRIAREAADGDMLARAATLLNWHPAFKPLPGESDALREALTLLPEAGFGMRGEALRGVVLCALSCAAPECFDRTRSEQLLAEGVPLVRKSGSRAARYAGLLSQLYAMGGPDHQALANALLDELEKLAHDNPRRLPVLPLDLSFYRAISALTHGDQPALRVAIQRASEHAREVQHVELSWHAERLQALADIHGARAEGKTSALRALHARALRESLLNTLPFCAFDQAVVLTKPNERAQLDDALVGALSYDASEPPGIWSMKTRALACAGLHEQARAMLQVVAPQDLARLPCDIQYLGSLGHLTRAALALGATDYLHALAALLARYPQRFAGNIALACDGPVPHLLGLIAQALAQPSLARAQLEQGLAMSEAAGFAALAREARRALATL